MTEEQIISEYIQYLEHLNGGYIKSLQNGESEEMDAELEDALKKNEVIIKALKLSASLQDKSTGVWVKASERLPEEDSYVNIKICDIELKEKAHYIEHNFFSKDGRLIYTINAFEWFDELQSSAPLQEESFLDLGLRQSSAPSQIPDEKDFETEEDFFEACRQYRKSKSSAPLQTNNEKILHDKVQELLSANATQYNKIAELEIQLAQAEEHICNLERNLS